MEYGNILYERGDYSQAKEILCDFYKISHDNKKNISKVILALWKIYAINILNDNWEELIINFNSLRNVIQNLKLNLDEEIKKTNSDSVKKNKIKINFILNYLILFRLKKSNQTTNIFYCIEGIYFTGLFSL